MTIEIPKVFIVAYFWNIWKFWWQKLHHFSWKSWFSCNQMTHRSLFMHPKSLPRYQPNSGDTFRYLEHALWTNIREERHHLRKGQIWYQICPFWKLNLLKTENCPGLTCKKLNSCLLSVFNFTKKVMFLSVFKITKIIFMFFEIL